MCMKFKDEHIIALLAHRDGLMSLCSRGAAKLSTKAKLSCET